MFVEKLNNPLSELYNLTTLTFSAILQKIHLYVCALYPYCCWFYGGGGEQTNKTTNNTMMLWKSSVPSRDVAGHCELHHTDLCM